MLHRSDCEWMDGREFDPEPWDEALAALAALEAEHQQLRKALMRIEANETVPGGAGVIRGDAAKIARDALERYGEHQDDCESQVGFYAAAIPAPCTCGLADALRSVPAEPGRAGASTCPYYCDSP